MYLKTSTLIGSALLSVFLYNFNLFEKLGQTAAGDVALLACELELGEDVQLSVWDSLQLVPQASCPFSLIESFSWEPEGYLSCSDCLEPFVYPLEDICYTLTINWDDGCVSTDEICVSRKNCDAGFTENNINGITPQQISDQADIELEIARTQFVHIEIVENDEVQFTIWEGFVKAGLRTINLDFSAVPAGSHELRVRLYPEDHFISIEKL